jgi:hypothetical protein
MGRINLGRVVGGGLLAGLVLNVYDFVVHGVLLEADWQAAMTALGKPADTMDAGAIAVFVVIDFIIGIFSVWLYAAMRPRFGPGPRTAVIAALALWFVAVIFTASQAPLGLFPPKLLWLPIAGAVVVVPLAVAAGAYVYREEEAEVMQAA